MSNLLYLVHRLPFPPNKGDKVRSYHLLKHLTAQHRVFLGTFVDDPADEIHIDQVREMCPDLHVARLHPRLAKLRSLTGLLTHQALSVRYYQSAPLQAWVRQTLAEHHIDAVVVFSSVMAQYIKALPGVASPPLLVDFVDVDSAKWTQYASAHRWPLSWLYRREGEQLLAYERAVATRSMRSFFVTENEADLFRKAALESADKVMAISNGVDADYFSPDPARASPFVVDPGQPSEVAIVFTGAMDYWPNIDAVTWFARDILPALRQRWPQVRLYIVGRSPPPVVQALASDAVVVTGTVADVRPYLQYAALVVAPLRVARGIQNKILEAMAMARPVVASHSCVKAIAARMGEEIVGAFDQTDFVREINVLLSDPDRADAIGQSARKWVLSSFSWPAHLGCIDPYLSSLTLERDKA